MSTESTRRWIQQVYDIEAASPGQRGAGLCSLRDKEGSEWELVTGELVLPENETVRWLEAENDISIKKTVEGDKLADAGEAGRAYMYQKKPVSRGNARKGEADYQQLGACLAAKHRSWQEKLPMNGRDSVSLAEQTIKAEYRQMKMLLPKGQTMIRQSINALCPVIERVLQSDGTGFVFREMNWEQENMGEGVLFPGAMPGVHVSLYDLASLLRAILLSFSGERDYQPFARMVFNELLAGYDSVRSIPLSSLQQFANILEWHDLYQYALLWQKAVTGTEAAVRVREQLRLEHRLPLLEI
ncbi:hypothetical protein SAMN05421781_1660 [Marinococcus luteus]|uniref:Uncharacterized protein n=1 Tax=Marinococcus luteus TaxID=1122204 RepID=A0A1H2UCH4_9BACI|nr:hypothetical protein [Marinococcus luteus]SDW53800.1 hypothetical protein SAMN05421781_1660 [Marinococcus luteus]